MSWRDIKLLKRIGDGAADRVWLLPGKVHFTGTEDQAVNRVDGFNPLTDITLHQWYVEYKRLASKWGVPYLVADMETYREYYEENMTPEDTLSSEISYATD